MLARVWDALADHPTGAANKRMRSELVIAIRQAVAEWHVTQAAARRLKLMQSRLNDLLRGRINDYSLDALTVPAARAGLDVWVRVERAAGQLPKFKSTSALQSSQPSRRAGTFSAKWPP